jgi:hypothetical protein
VSACLRGEESARRVDSDGAAGPPPRRARAALHDAAHEPVDPGCTERACLHLVVPPDASCTLDSDAVQVTTTCTVDVTVGPPPRGSASGSGGLRNLRLDIPVRVVHPVASYERREEDGCEDPRRSVPSVDQLMRGRGRTPPSAESNGADPADPLHFRRHDIAEELKVLSLALADRLGLRPSPPGVAGAQ